MHGGRLVIVPTHVTRAPDLFRALVADEGVTILNQTPSAFYPIHPKPRRRRAMARLLGVAGQNHPSAVRHSISRASSRGPSGIRCARA